MGMSRFFFITDTRELNLRYLRNTKMCQPVQVQEQLESKRASETTKNEFVIADRLLFRLASYSSLAFRLHSNF